MPGRYPTDFFEFLLRLGDDALILGHRLSEWCSYAPTLEEDLALANIALDCIGQASALLAFAADVEGNGRTADRLAYFRNSREYRSSIIFELPHGHDFAFTIAQQVLVDAFRYLHFETLAGCTDSRLAGIAAKASKETAYHLRHSSSWAIRLGDGTDESKTRIQQAFVLLTPFAGELFVDDDVESRLAAQGLACSRSKLKDRWNEIVSEVFKQATLRVELTSSGTRNVGWQGQHTEHLESLLSEMQSVARAHPGATW
ncbi:MAG: 1,2-phenylacetyl-CoA epoxidase subunit PaaC [Bdellovibrionota bacterium]